MQHNWEGGLEDNASSAHSTTRRISQVSRACLFRAIGSRKPSRWDSELVYVPSCSCISRWIRRHESAEDAGSRWHDDCLPEQSAEAPVPRAAS